MGRSQAQNVTSYCLGSWGGVESSQERCEYGCDILLKSRIMVNTLWLFFVLECEVKRGRD